MNGTADKVKGRVEEAAGVLTNDQKLKNRGKVDQASGKVKDVIGKTIDKAVAAVNHENKR
ncbi:MAG: CsbD family protein [Candidatus Binatus sp.]